MRRSFIKKSAFGLAAVMAITTVLTGCGGSDSASGDDANTFTWTIDTAVSSVYYDSYNDNPVYQYYDEMTWDVDGVDTDITINFNQLPAGSESDTMNTLMATGEYDDVISANYLSDSLTSLYEEGVILDLTDLVDQYMPNFKAWMEENPGFAQYMYTNVNGEMKILQLRQVYDRADEYWSGYVYRRDWLVKYGTNPETGEAFTGGYVDDEKTEWEDDVVFPSGGTDPVYISDWEWMFDIFETALKEQGITDGYAYQEFYIGDFLKGDITSGFNAGCSFFYIDEDGVCRYGGTSDGYRAYLECMNTWYENGWMNSDFEENTSDLYWSVDSPSVYSGKVGLWYGLDSVLGNNLDVSNGDESDPTYNMCVYGAAQPINDVYGDLETCSSTPNVFMNYTHMYGNGVAITSKAADKNLAALLTAIDYQYGEEGAKLDRGFSKEQQAELNDEFYNEWGLEDGAYWSEDRDGVTWDVKNSVITNTQDLNMACGIARMNVGLTVNTNYDLGGTAIKNHAVDQWMLYACDAEVQSATEADIDSESSDTISLMKTNMMTYMAQTIPGFITGRTDISSDSDWQSYCDGYMAYDPQFYCDKINEILGN